MDAHFEKDASVVTKNQDFYAPLAKTATGRYKWQNTLVYTCFTSDFLLPEADAFRPECFRMMRLRQDLHFVFLTKRIERLASCLPPDWGEGYENVTIGCTVENQKRADFRLPIFLRAPIRHKIIVCEPLLSAIQLTPFLSDAIEEVTAGGESGVGATPLDFEWILQLQAQCRAAHVNFTFHQTGATLIKEGKCYRIRRALQHKQAKAARVDLHFTKTPRDTLPETPPLLVPFEKL